MADDEEMTTLRSGRQIPKGEFGQLMGGGAKRILDHPRTLKLGHETVHFTYREFKEKVQPIIDELFKENQTLRQRIADGNERIRRARERSITAHVNAMRPAENKPAKPRVCIPSLTNVRRASFAGQTYLCLRDVVTAYDRMRPLARGVSAAMQKLGVNHKFRRDVGIIKISGRGLGLAVPEPRVIEVLAALGTMQRAEEKVTA